MMAWLTGVITGTATLLGVLIGGRLSMRGERKQWLRDQRLRVCVELIEQVESFISERHARRTGMDKSVGTLIILGPADLADRAGFLVVRAVELHTAVFGEPTSDTARSAFREAEWGFRAAATKALGVKDTVSLDQVNRAAATPSNPHGLKR